MAPVLNLNNEVSRPLPRSVRRRSEQAGGGRAGGLGAESLAGQVEAAAMGGFCSPGAEEVAELGKWQSWAAACHPASEPGWTPSSPEPRGYLEWWERPWRGPGRAVAMWPEAAAAVPPRETPLTALTPSKRAVW